MRSRSASSKNGAARSGLRSVRLDRCVALRRNPQYLTPHEMDALKRSIERDGFLVPILVRSLRCGRYEIVSGNHRAMAAKELGHVRVPAVVAKMDDRSSRRIAVNLNTVHGEPTAELMAPFLAEMDAETLAQVHLPDDMIAEIASFDATLRARLAALEVPSALDRDSAPNLPMCVCAKCGRRHVPSGS